MNHGPTSGAEAERWDRIQAEMRASLRKQVRNGEVVTGIPTRGCWETNGEEIWVTACRDAPAQRWQAVPVSS